MDLGPALNPVICNLQEKGEGDLGPEAHREEGHMQPETRIKAIIATSQGTPSEGRDFRLQASRIRRK